MELILSIVIIILLIAVILLILTRKTQINHTIDTDPIQKQLAINTTEQFKQFDIMQQSMSRSLMSLQESNEKRLNEIRGVVEEKLQKTLNTRLTESFKQIGEQLNSVHRGLGEMKSLASDTKSLKIALTNSVKERGTYGEVRLEALLSDILIPSQYESQALISDNKRVDFAINLPGIEEDKPLLLPIDSKFPLGDYTQLLRAEDKTEIELAKKSLAKSIKLSAKEICEKYIVPPITTDFALMFLPTEGLYAEVAQNDELYKEIRTKYKITPVGPVTLSAFLSSLQIGFKTLTFEKHSQEAWNTLREVKKAFADFHEALETAQKQLNTVDKTISNIVGAKTRKINKALENVCELESGDDFPVT
jgi:DNA recombination protein RmuC